MQKVSNNTEYLSDLFRQAFQHLKNNNFAAAEINYLKILDYYPNHADSLNYLGAIKHNLGDNESALIYLKKAALYSTEDAEIFFNLGCVYAALTQWDNALQAFEKAIQIKPDYAMAHNNISNVLFNLKNFAQQKQHVFKAYELAPNEYEIIVNYANQLVLKSHYIEAIELFKKALAINPLPEQVVVSLCQAYYKLSQHKEAQKYLRKIDFADGQFSKFRSGLLFSYNYEPSATPDEIFKAHQQWGQALLNTIDSKNVQRVFPKKNNFKLRIGYFSGDFNCHPVSYFLENILKNHDTSKFTIIAYSKSSLKDTTTEKLKTYFSLWRDLLDLNNNEIFDLIVNDEIDILVDLAGHTSPNILEVFARRPAPVQMTYLGYPNTTGLPTMDYRITDPWCDPPGLTDKWHTEKLIRLNTGFLCYRPPDNCPPISSAPFESNGYITFGCFNNSPKINDTLVVLWSKILNEIPGSVVVLKGEIYSNELIRSKTLEHISQNGISPEKIRLIPFIKNSYEALNAYNNIDIALDTFPYNGTTTTSEALWMGVPVITLVGQTHISRVSFSILNQIGATQLAAFSEEEYVKKAIDLAKNLEELKELRNKLRQLCQISSFTDGENFTKGLEFTYEKAWHIFNQQN